MTIDEANALLAIDVARRETELRREAIAIAIYGEWTAVDPATGDADTPWRYATRFHRRGARRMAEAALGALGCDDAGELAGGLAPAER